MDTVTPTMKHFIPLFTWATCFSLVSAAVTFGQKQGPILPDDSFVSIPAVDRERIERATPDTLSARPQAPRKVLIFNLHLTGKEVRPGHPSIPYGNYMFQVMGEKSGAYEVFFSRDPAVFKKDYLDQFDAVVFNNTAGVLTEDEQLRNDLLDYVTQGGGFVGIHAAGATFCQWPRYDFFPQFGVMLGGFESGGHPWKAYDWITLKVDEPEHPISRVFGRAHIDVSDEVFQFTDPYSRDRNRVVLSIDPRLTDMNPERRMLPERMADQDFAMSWVKRYGRGRVFYTSLGHNEHIFWNPPLIRHMLDGLQFAMGDLDGPTIPSSKVTPAVEAQENLGWRFGIEAYTFKNDTFFDVVEKTSALGLAYVGGLNVQPVSKEIDKPFDYKLTSEERRAIREKLADEGMSLLTYFVFDLPGDEAECRKIFEFGKEMGIETFISEPKVEDLDLIERLCVEYNIKVAIHNHGERLSPVYMYPERIVELCEGRSPLIGAACDFGHWAKEGIDPYEAIKTLGDRVITVQMHDQSALTAEGHDVPWGTGVVNLDGILAYMTKRGIEPVMFGLEYSYEWDKSMPAIRQSISYFNQQSLIIAANEAPKFSQN